MGRMFDSLYLLIIIKATILIIIICDLYMVYRVEESIMKLFEIAISLIISLFGIGIIILSKFIPERIFCSVRYGYKISDKEMYIKEFRKMIYFLGILYIIYSLFIWSIDIAPWLFLILQSLIFFIGFKRQKKYISKVM